MKTRRKDEAIEALLAVRPDPGDPVGLALSRSRVSARLFGDRRVARVGRYHVLERLGAGGMGVVYRAHDPELDRPVAIKLVRVREGRKASALNEAKALARLSHPNVVAVHDVGALDRHIYIVMELVRGMTLAQWTKQPGRTPEEIVRAYRDAGAGLAAAHAVGLVHRDFKPDNVIVSEDGRARVIDFGLACDSRYSTEAVPVGGTPRYMAPENANGRVPSPAADQYSFALALREALLDAAPRRTARVLARACATDPLDRYASMNALLAALGDERSRASRSFSRSAIALLLALVVGFVLGTVARDRLPTSPAHHRAR